MQYKRLWTALAIVIIGSFAVLGSVGYNAIENAPAVPSRVLIDGGAPVFERDTIRSGQNVWQSLGGQQVGSIFGHGAYVAPDWTADWLHRESLFILHEWARKEGVTDFELLPADRQAGLKARLQEMMRINTYNPVQDTVTIDPVRASAFEDCLSFRSAWARLQRITEWKDQDSTEFPSIAFFRIRSQERGTHNWVSSGSPLHGSQRVFISPRPSAVSSPPISG